MRKAYIILYFRINVFIVFSLLMDTHTKRHKQKKRDKAKEMKKFIIDRWWRSPRREKKKNEIKTSWSRKVQFKQKVWIFILFSHPKRMLSSPLSSSFFSFLLYSCFFFAFSTFSRCAPSNGYSQFLFWFNFHFSKTAHTVWGKRVFHSDSSSLLAGCCCSLFLFFC